MNDIYDIKNTLLGFPINMIYSLIFISTIIVIIVLIRYFLKREPKEKIVKEVMKKQKEQKNYEELLMTFEKEYITYKSDIFYSKLIEILREILEDKENKNISKMTFSEINFLNIDDDLKKLIKDIYYKEYTRLITGDNANYRKGLIDKVRGEI